MNFENHVEEKDVFHFNEVTSIVGVKPYVLRFWESEFTQISPGTDSKGQKLYSSTDLDQIDKIKNLLFEEKYSIQQAKNFLDQEIQEAIIMKQKELDAQVVASEVSHHGNDSTVNIATPISEHVTSKTSSFDLMKMALGEKLKSAEVLLKEAERPAQNHRQISDKDIVHLVQAKKKLTNVLSRIDQLAETRSWN